MKKFAVLFMLLTTGILSCSSCTKKEVVTDPELPEQTCDEDNCAESSEKEDASKEDSSIPVTPEQKPQVFSGDTWELTLPVGWKKTEQVSEDTILTATLKDEHLIFFLLKEEYKGPYENYIISAIRGIKNAKLEIKSLKQVEINGTKFVLLETYKDDFNLLIWITAKNGFGYGLSCGGPTSPKFDECTQIASSFKIK